MIDERIPVLERIQNVRQFFVDEINATLARDDVLCHEIAECKKATKEHSIVVDSLSAKQKEHFAVAQLRDKVESIICKASGNIINLYFFVVLQLQELCRMIQQQTKDIVANSGEFESEDLKKTTAQDTQFTTSIEQISSQLVEQEDSLKAQDAENKELQEKLSQFEEHILLRSQHYAAQLKAKDLEQQLEEAKLAQQHHRYQETAYNFENSTLRMAAVRTSNSEMTKQLAMYTDKFVTFEEALTRSTSMFSQFQKEIADLNRMLEKSNQEKSLRKEICCKLDLTLFDLMDSKSNGGKPSEELSEALAEKARLQQECRELQQRRAELIRTRAKVI